MEATIPTTRTADLYLMNCRLRAEIPMLAFTRLSDVLNNVPGIFMHGALLGTGAASDAAAPAGGRVQRDFVVRLQDVLFVCPLAEMVPGAQLSAERRERLQQPMVLQMDGWCIKGSLHLVDHVRWVDFATSANTRFIAVTDASISPPGLAAPFDCPLLFVNGARLSALYEPE